MKLVANLDFNKLQSLNRIAQNLATAPGTPSAGQEYYDTAQLSAYFWNGTAWVSTDASKVPNAYIPIAKLTVDPTLRANHTGTQLSATISDLATTVKAYTLNSFAAPVANVPMNGFTLTGLNTGPSAAGQAAEYSWVVSQIQASAAGIDSKPPADALATANVVSLSGTAQTIDGVVLNTVGMRVLLTGQTTGSQNGPWVVQSGAWIRPPGEVVNPQAFYFISQGTTWKGSQWKCTNSPPITLDTTALTFVQFGVTNTYTAGNGLQLVATSFSVLLNTNSGLAASGSGLSVQLQANPGLSLSATGIAVQLQAASGLTLGATGLAIDTTSVVRKYAVLIGDGTSTSITVTHSLGNQDVVTQIRDAVTNAVVLADVVNNGANTVLISFAVAPTTNAYRVVVQG